MVETSRVTGHVTGERPGCTYAGGGRLGRQDPRGRLDASGGRCGSGRHLPCDVMWGVGHGRPRVVDSGLT